MLIFTLSFTLFFSENGPNSLQNIGVVATRFLVAVEYFFINAPSELQTIAQFFEKFKQNMKLTHQLIIQGTPCALACTGYIYGGCSRDYFIITKSNTKIFC